MLHDTNGKFKLPGWSKPVLLAALVGAISWGLLDYLENTTRLTIVETNYSNILKILEKLDKKMDEIHPDYGPAIDLDGRGRR